MKAVIRMVISPNFLLREKIETLPCYAKKRTQDTLLNTVQTCTLTLGLQLHLVIDVAKYAFL